MLQPVKTQSGKSVKPPTNTSRSRLKKPAPKPVTTTATFSNGRSFQVNVTGGTRRNKRTVTFRTKPHNTNDIVNTTRKKKQKKKTAKRKAKKTHAHK